jgi:hypothetical protein
MAGEEEQDGIERVAANRTDFFLGDLCKGKRRAALEVDIIRKGECGQRRQWRAREKVGRRPVCSKRVRLGMRTFGPRTWEVRTFEVLKKVSHCLSLIL